MLSYPRACRSLGSLRVCVKDNPNETGIKRHTIFVQVLDHSREVLLRLLVKVGDGDTGGEDGVVRMFSREVRSSLSGEVLRIACKQLFVKLCMHLRQARPSSLPGTHLQ